MRQQKVTEWEKKIELEKSKQAHVTALYLDRVAAAEEEKDYIKLIHPN